MFISYWCPMSEDFFFGYLAKTENSSLHIAEPFCYEWLKQINKLEWLEENAVRNIPLNMTSFKPIPDFVVRFDNFILDFDLLEEDRHQFHGISSFFSHFLYFKNATLLERLEQSISKTEFLLSPSALKRIVEFILKVFHSDVDRFRILYSPKIQSILKGHEYV